MWRKEVEASIDSQRKRFAEDWCREGKVSESSLRTVLERALPWWAMYGRRRQPNRCAIKLVLRYKSETDRQNKRRYKESA